MAAMVHHTARIYANKIFEIKKWSCTRDKEQALECLSRAF